MINTRHTQTAFRWLLAYACCQAVFLIQAAEKETSTNTDIVFNIQHEDVYRSSSSVVLHYEVLNRSGKPMKIFRPSPVIYDMEISLIGPDGKRVLSSLERDGNVQHLLRKMNLRDLHENGGFFKEELNLSAFYPIEKVGEYTCRVSKPVYEVDASFVRKSAKDAPGKKTILVSGEFRFRVDGLDDAYGLKLKEEAALRERLASGSQHNKSNTDNGTSSLNPSLSVQPPAPKKAPEAKPTQPAPSEEPASSTPWSVIVVLIVAATGLLWLLVKKRK